MPFLNHQRTLSHSVFWHSKPCVCPIIELPKVHCNWAFYMWNPEGERIYFIPLGTTCKYVFKLRKEAKEGKSSSFRYLFLMISFWTVNWIGCALYVTCLKLKNLLKMKNLTIFFHCTKNAKVLLGAPESAIASLQLLNEWAVMYVNKSRQYHIYWVLTMF